MTRKLYLLLGLLCGAVFVSACGNTGKEPEETSAAASLEETKQTEAKQTSQAAETETMMLESSSEIPTQEPFEIGDFILTSKSYCDEQEFTFVLPYFVSTSDTLTRLNQQIEDDFKAICEDAAARIEKNEGLEYYSVDWYSVEYFNQLALYVYAARGEEDEPKVYLYDQDKDQIMTKEDFLLLAGFEEKEFLKKARKIALDYYMSMPKGEQSCYPDLTDARTLKKYVSMENQMYVNGDMECVVLFLELGKEGYGFRYHTIYVPLNGVG